MRGMRHLSTLVSYRSPGAPTVVGDEFVSRHWSGATGWIIRKIVRFLRCPCIKHWLNDAPTRLYHVRALEQRCIADHAIVDERLISDVRLRREPVLVGKARLYGRQSHSLPRPLDLELQRDAFFGLDLQDEPVRAHLRDISAFEQRKRGAPEVNG